MYPAVVRVELREQDKLWASNRLKSEIHLYYITENTLHARLAQVKNCLLKRVIKRKLEEAGRHGDNMPLLVDLEETRRTEV